MIDINQPVKQGQDMILNYDGEPAVLGSASGFEREAKAGKLIGLPPNDNPNGDPNVGDTYDNGPASAQPSRDGNGKFTKK